MSHMSLYLRYQGKYQDLCAQMSNHVLTLLQKYAPATPIPK